MKKLLFLLTMIVIATTSVTAKTFQFGGEVHQTKGEPVTITVFSDNTSPVVYECQQESRILGLKTVSVFSLKLEKDSNYTLLFQSATVDKMVYVDTKNISSMNQFVCHLREVDAIIHYEPVYRYPIASHMEYKYLDWVIKAFPVVRAYEPETVKQESPKLLASE